MSGPAERPDVPTGRVARLRAVLGTRRASLVLRSIGYLLIFGGFLVALQGQLVIGLWVVLLGWLSTRAARSNYNAGRMTWLLDGLVARDALDGDLAGVPASLALETLVEQDARQQGGSGVYPVRQGPELVGIVDVLDADRIARTRWATTRVDALMKPLSALEIVPPDRPLLDIVVRFERTRREAFPVVDPAEPSSLLGFVTREKVHQLMRSRAARHDRERARARGATGR